MMNTPRNDVIVIEDYLATIKKRFYRDPDLENLFKNSIASAKESAVALGNQNKAKYLWCLENILDVQGNFLESFLDMKQKKFYNAWMTLERIAITLSNLDKHFQNGTNDPYCLEFIEKSVKQFQSLFPYVYFTSPGFIVYEKKCSICNQIIKLREPCDHIKGEIYDGEMCVHEVTNMKILEISIVTDPVQKYSVPFIQNSKGETVDQYDYSLVEYVSSGLNHPFVDWKVERTFIRYPHSFFPDLAPTDKCPCDSGKSYKDCCSREAGILRPHAKVYFGERPIANIPRFTYP